MFSGEESATFAAGKRSRDAVFDYVEDALSSLGHARVTDRGDIDVRPRGSLANTFTQVRLEGRVRERRQGDFTVTVDYSVGLSSAGWVIFVFGLLFFLLGVLVLLAPLLAKDGVGRAVRSALRNLD